MFRTFFKVALRTLLSQRMFSAINIGGLAVGIACSLLIFLFVLDELSYDTQWQDTERIYRVSRDWYATGDQEPLSLAAAPPQAAPLLREDFPEIETAARLYGGQALLRLGDTAFYEDSVRFADPEFFDVFDLEWMRGGPDGAIDEPFTIVLTETVARKYFGNADPMGETLLLENEIPMEVTGVIEDLPSNTHLSANVIASLATIPPVLGEEELQSWGSTNYHTYIRLRPGVDIESIESRFPAFMNRHFRENASRSTGLSAMPVSDIHLHSDRQQELSPPGDIAYIYTFSAVAFCILLIACFNFMNLSTARATQRRKEIGVRKSLGAHRGNIFRQFLGESFLMAVIATVVALVLVELAMPFFNRFTGKALSLDPFGDIWLQASLLALVAFVGFFAGGYPALYLSRFQASSILKGEFFSGLAGQGLRNLLVVLQFSVAIVLLVSTATVLAQMRHAHSLSLEFAKDQVVILTGSPTGGLGGQWESLKEELLRYPEITRVTASNLTPLEPNTNSFGFRPEGVENGRNMANMWVEYDFFSTFNIEVLAGRTFSESFPADRIPPITEQGETATGKFILNRAAAEVYGWTPEEALGKGATIYGFNSGNVEGSIIGVVENNHFESARSTIKPLVFVLPPRTMQNGVPSVSDASVKITGENLQATLQHIDSTWRTLLPEFPVNRRFLDAEFEALYQSESRQGEMFSYFSVLAMLIACLGLYGLAVFNTERRTKEIGVRKVMGAGVWRIVLLLTNDFSKLVLLANVIAWPVAWFAMDRWLENFAYRIDLTPMIFIGSGLIALCIAWVTVGGTAARAANARPALALRYE